MAKEYLVCVQHKYQEEKGDYSNLKAMNGTLRASGVYYSNLTEARKDLKAYIAKQNKKGARTERKDLCGLGILVEFTEEEADRARVIKWFIKKRTVTPWEVVDKC